MKSKQQIRYDMQVMQVTQSQIEHKIEQKSEIEKPSISYQKIDSQPDWKVKNPRYETLRTQVIPAIIALIVLIPILIFLVPLMFNFIIIGICFLMYYNR